MLPQGKKFLESNYIIILVAVSIRVFMALSLVGRYQSDETSRGLEVAYYLLTGREYYQFQSGYYVADKLWNYNWPLLLTPFLWIGLKLGFEGLQIFTFMRLLMGLLNVSTIPAVQSFFEERRQKAVIGWSLALFWPFAFFGIQVIIDSLALSFLLFALPYLRKMEQGTISNPERVILGILLALTVTFRLPFAVILLPMFIHLAKKNEYLTILGSVLGSVPYVVIDWVFYGSVLQTPINFLRYNVIEQRFNAGPVLSWWYYFLMIPGYFFGILGFAMVLFAMNSKRSELWTSPTSRNLLVGTGIYTLIFLSLKHKELRFVVAPSVLLLVFSTGGIVKIAENNHMIFTGNRRKLFVTYLIIFSLIAIATAPYKSEANLWKAQAYVRHLDPDANVAIDAYYWATGGHLLQHEPGSDGIITILYADLDRQIIFGHDYQYVILDQKSTSYNVWISEFGDHCLNFQLVKEFKDSYPLSVSSYFVPNGLFEVYTCS